MTPEIENKKLILISPAQGALTHGDRRATDMPDLVNRYNIDDKYAKQALEQVVKVIAKARTNLVPFPECRGPQSFLSGI